MLSSERSRLWIQARRFHRLESPYAIINLSRRLFRHPASQASQEPRLRPSACFQRRAGCKVPQAFHFLQKFPKQVFRGVLHHFCISINISEFKTTACTNYLETPTLKTMRPEATIEKGKNVQGVIALAKHADLPALRSWLTSTDFNTDPSEPTNSHQRI
jgi:hypothetical protein